MARIESEDLKDFPGPFAAGRAVVRHEDGSSTVVVNAPYTEAMEADLGVVARTGVTAGKDGSLWFTGAAHVDPKEGVTYYSGVERRGTGGGGEVFFLQGGGGELTAAGLAEDGPHRALGEVFFPEADSLPAPSGTAASDTAPARSLEERKSLEEALDRPNAFLESLRGTVARWGGEPMPPHDTRRDANGTEPGGPVARLLRRLAVRERWRLPATADGAGAVVEISGVRDQDSFLVTLSRGEEGQRITRWLRLGPDASGIMAGMRDDLEQGRNLDDTRDTYEGHLRAAASPYGPEALERMERRIADITGGHPEALGPAHYAYLMCVLMRDPELRG